MARVQWSIGSWLSKPDWAGKKAIKKYFRWQPMGSFRYPVADMKLLLLELVKIVVLCVTWVKMDGFPISQDRSFFFHHLKLPQKLVVNTMNNCSQTNV